MSENEIDCFLLVNDIINEIVSSGALFLLDHDIDRSVPIYTVFRVMEQVLE